MNTPALPGGLVHGGDELMDEAVHLELRVIRTVRLVGVVEKYMRWPRGTNKYKCSQFSKRNHNAFVLIIEYFCLYLFQCIDLKLVCAVKNICAGVVDSFLMETIISIYFYKKFTHF